jgi:hypothetical protein
MLGYLTILITLFFVISNPELLKVRVAASQAFLTSYGTRGSLSYSRDPSVSLSTCKVNPVHIITPYFWFILVLSFHLRLGLLGDIFPSDFPTSFLFCSSPP